MSKIIVLKYDVGDVAYTMLGDKPFKVEIVNFSLSYDKKLPIEERIQYEVGRYPAPKIHPYVIKLHISYTYNYKKLDEIFDTKEELLESLIKKIRGL